MTQRPLSKHAPCLAAATILTALSACSGGGDADAAYERGFADGAASVRDGDDGLTACQGNLTTCNTSLTSCQDGTPSCGDGTSLTTGDDGMECTVAEAACGEGTELSDGVCARAAHCSDGEQNEDETGRDCGGSCAPCSALEPVATTPAGEFYAFISPSNADRVTMITTFAPGLSPFVDSEAPRFSTSTAYDFHIDNDGDADADITLRFEFTDVLANEDAILEYVGPVDGVTSANRNVRQTYDLTRIDADGTETLVVDDGNTASWFIGNRTFPGSTYETVTNQAVVTSGDVTAFAGPRDDPYFADLSIWDLLGVAGVPRTSGRNALVIAVELPIASVAAGGTRPTAVDGATSLLGMHATTSELVLANDDVGRVYAQTSRADWPTIEDFFLPLGERAAYATGSPVDDDDFMSHIRFPEMRDLLVAILGIGCPETPTEGRTDLVGLLSPNGTTTSTLLRLNIAQGQTGANTAFPNGRRLADDVVDTMWTLACNSGAPVGDGVDANDVVELGQMPYVGAPH